MLASAGARDMEDHDPRMFCWLLCGNFSTVTMVSLTEKKVKLSIHIGYLWEKNRESMLRKSKRELVLERLLRCMGMMCEWS